MAFDELEYDPAAIEGSNACSPACINEGICQNRICFCEVPYGGNYCQDDLDVVFRLNIALFVVILIGALVIGFLLVFILKFVWDCLFFKELEPLKEEDDEWKP